jgi:hypothetical protein
MLGPLSYRNHILTKNRQGDAKADEKRYIYPACKMEPPENRGPNLNFLGCFVRYQSTYEQSVSTPTRDPNKFSSANPQECIDPDEREVQSTKPPADPRACYNA